MTKTHKQETKLVRDKSNLSKSNSSPAPRNGVIEEILKEAWKEHMNTPNFETYDVEGINSLVKIAIKKAIQSKEKEVIKMIDNMNECSEQNANALFLLAEAQRYETSGNKDFGLYNRGVSNGIKVFIEELKQKLKGAKQW